MFITSYSPPVHTSCVFFCEFFVIVLAIIIYCCFGVLWVVSLQYFLVFTSWAGQYGSILTSWAGQYGSVFTSWAGQYGSVFTFWGLCHGSFKSSLGNMLCLENCYHAPCAKFSHFLARNRVLIYPGPNIGQSTSQLLQDSPIVWPLSIPGVQQEQELSCRDTFKQTFTCQINSLFYVKFSPIAETKSQTLNAIKPLTKFSI